MVNMNPFINKEINRINVEINNKNNINVLVNNNKIINPFQQRFENINNFPKNNDISDNNKVIPNDVNNVNVNNNKESK